MTPTIHPLTHWPLTHHPQRPTRPTKPTISPLYDVLHDTNQIFSETSWQPVSTDSLTTHPSLTQTHQAHHMAFWVSHSLLCLVQYCVKAWTRKVLEPPTSRLVAETLTLFPHWLNFLFERRKRIKVQTDLCAAMKPLYFFLQNYNKLLLKLREAIL